MISHRYVCDHCGHTKFTVSSDPVAEFRLTCLGCGNHAYIHVPDSWNGSGTYNEGLVNEEVYQA